MASKILGLVPIAQSLALAGDGFKFAEKKDKDTMDFVGQGVKSIVGVKLIGETANIIESF